MAEAGISQEMIDESVEELTSIRERISGRGSQGPRRALKESVEHLSRDDIDAVKKSVSRLAAAERMLRSNGWYSLKDEVEAIRTRLGNAVSKAVCD